MVGGRGVRLARESVVRDGEFFLALDPREEQPAGDPASSRSGIASAIELPGSRSCSRRACRRERTARFDAEAPARRRGHDRLWYLDLLLREEPSRPSIPAEAVGGPGRGPAPRAARVLPRGPAGRGLAGPPRTSVKPPCPSSTGPSSTTPPSPSSSPMPAARANAASRRSERVPTRSRCLQGRLTHAQRRELDQSAPDTRSGPQRPQIRLDLRARPPPRPRRPPPGALRLDRDPAARPAAASRGLLHLLGPNSPARSRSPTDLRSFWTTTYLQVRKDLRDRYPKHSWPEDPFTAPPATGPRRRKE